MPRQLLAVFWGAICNRGANCFGWLIVSDGISFLGVIVLGGFLAGGLMVQSLKFGVFCRGLLTQNCRDLLVQPFGVLKTTVPSLLSEI